MKRRWLFAIAFFVLTKLTVAQNVQLLYDKSLPQAVYAAGMLYKPLLNKGYTLKSERTTYTIGLAVKSHSLGESDLY
jgi:hypothetical protein